MISFLFWSYQARFHYNQNPQLQLQRVPSLLVDGSPDVDRIDLALDSDLVGSSGG